jgi:hypothetical protein
MQFDPLLNDALDPLLRRSAVFAEPHAIKGLLALERLKRLPGFSDTLAREALGWNQLLFAPEVKGPISEQVDWAAEQLTDTQLTATIVGAVFPLAYVAGAEWVRRHGFRHMLESFEERAIERVGYLGHSWTVWCSFFEIAPQLNTPEREVMASERFVEYCASQLSDPDWTSAYPLCFGLETLEPGENEAITAILTRPGFYGHHAITLAYLFKYRDRLTLAQWKHGLQRMYDASLDKELCPAAQRDAVDRATLGRAVVDYVNRAANEVHTLTLADSIYELWEHLEPRHRARLFDVLDAY